MALREIIKYQTNDILKREAKKVDKIDTTILTILEDMTDTLYNAGGNGLAGPQVGVSLRLIVVRGETKYLKLINPVIVKSAGEQISPEGCLSLPGIYGKVKRPEFIVIEALDVNGNRVDMKASYRLAAIFAHEIDHLDGVLMIDKAIQVITYKKRKRDFITTQNETAQ